MDYAHMPRLANQNQGHLHIALNGTLAKTAYLGVNYDLLGVQESLTSLKRDLREKIVKFLLKSVFYLIKSNFLH